MWDKSSSLQKQMQIRHSNHKEIQKQMQTSASWFFHVQTLEQGIVPRLFHHKASQKTDSDTTAPGQVQSQVLT